jgi:aminopeptidase
MDLVQRFADLVVRVGVNVQPGQGVVVLTDTAHLAIARAIVERAYQAGAAWVEPVFTDGPIRRSAVDHASLESLTATRPWAVEQLRGWSEERAALIAVHGDPDPHLFDGADPTRATAVRGGELAVRREASMSGQMRWTVVAAPHAGWATEIFGEPDLDRLWAAIGTAMRLDEEDPVAQWRERTATLAARAAALTKLGLTEVRYLGEDTDLTVGLIPDCQWIGGGMTDSQGITYMPNIPTEEVFTSPDKNRADGMIRLTKPLALGGRLVEGLRLEFKDGAITNVTADSNAEIVRAQLEAPGSRHLGEVSLVDRDSRVAKAGIVFRNTLFDENAGCHVAYGQAFPFTVPGGTEMSAEERAAQGLNASTVHTDVVIGGEGITVTGRGPGGEVTIIRDDEWVL